MVAAECSNVVLKILFKSASMEGLSYYIFIAYCYVLGTLVFLTLVLLFNRKTVLPPLNFPFISRIFLLGFIGYSGLICSYKGLALSSPSLASATSNLTPAFTFILAVLFSILQSQVMKMYPEEIVVNFFYNMSVTFISLPGLFGFSFSSTVHTWGVRLKGPVFVASFRPTAIVIAVVMSAIFLGEPVYLGSVIGAVVLTAGLYAVLWGKAKEEEMIDDGSGTLSSGTVPLLQT
ncbi:hypothetical protein PTKIN_Ptkin08bG0039400 [Pterospermum kingtungense]